MKIKHKKTNPVMNTIDGQSFHRPGIHLQLFTKDGDLVIILTLITGTWQSLTFPRYVSHPLSNITSTRFFYTRSKVVTGWRNDRHKHPKHVTCQHVAVLQVFRQRHNQIDMGTLHTCLLVILENGKFHVSLATPLLGTHPITLLSTQIAWADWTCTQSTYIYTNGYLQRENVY